MAVTSRPEPAARSGAAAAPSAPPPPRGASGWLHDGLQWLRVRLELFSVEAREHALSVLEVLLLGLAAVLLLVLGLAFLAVLLTVLLWDSHRLLALAVFTTVFLTLGAVAVGLAKARWAQTRRWFQATLDEFWRDEDRLTPP